VNALRRWLWALSGVGILAAVVYGFLHAGELLDRFAPFDLDATPDLFTELHLLLFSRDPGRCFAALDGGHIGYEHAPNRAIENGCGYRNAAVLTRSKVSYGGPVLMRCPALLSLLLWERHVVGPAARQELGTRITGIRQLGTYSCRNINHAAIGRRSQHALANAIDIGAFRTEEGAVISVATDWSDSGARGKFLHAVRDGACRFFGIVLSPDYNALHHDHFHLDTGLWSVCR
jgi:hypothetical protein